MVDVTSSRRAAAANNLAASGHIIAYAALLYSPASIAVGLFGMDVNFIQHIEGPGYSAFSYAVLACYVPVLLWFLMSKIILPAWRLLMQRMRHQETLGKEADYMG